MTTTSVTDGVAVLRAEDLTKSFGGIRAVDHLNLTLARGELRCVIGPERRRQVDSVRLAIGCLHRPDAGHIVFKGEDITNLQPFQRVRKGLCQKFQTTRIYRALTVAQNLMIAERTPRWSWRKNGRRKNGILNWALLTLGLDLVGEVPAGKLSHSHQQWLEICLALATEPNLLLLDEPTAGMTPEEQN